MKFAFGSGDDGKTSILKGRVSKTASVIKAIGDVDELEAFIGHAFSAVKDARMRKTLKSVEHDLYIIGAELAGYLPNGAKRLSAGDVGKLDREISFYSKGLKEVKGFVYPNGSPIATQINVCRTVARRAERSVLEVPNQNDIVGRYMNRLSSLLFVMFRYANNRSRTKEEKLR